MANELLVVQGNTPRLLARKANDMELAAYLQGLALTYIT